MSGNLTTTLNQIITTVNVQTEAIKTMQGEISLLYLGAYVLIAIYLLWLIAILFRKHYRVEKVKKTHV